MAISVSDIKADAPEGTFLQFDRALEERLQGAAASLSISNAWTISTWIDAFDLDKGVASQYILEMKTSGSDANRIAMFINATVGQVEVSTFDSSGTALKTYAWAQAMLEGSASGSASGFEMVNLVLRWDGTTLSLFRNGSNLTGIAGNPIISTNNSGTMSDSPARVVTIGNSLAGSQGIDARMKSIAVWNKALEDAELKTLGNSGFMNMNVSVNQGNYISRANLVHWWRLGQPVGAIGVGGDFTVDQVESGGIDVEAADVGFTVGVNSERGFGLSIDFGNEFFENVTAQSIGIVNEWTISAWFRSDFPNSTGNRSSILSFLGAGSQIKLNRGSSNRPQIFMEDSSGVLFRDIIGNTTGFLTEDAWVHLVVAWDGTAGATGGIFFYKNGVLTNTQTVNTSIAGSQSDQNRTVEMASIDDDINEGSVNGSIGHVAVWNSALALDAIRQVYVGGFTTDLRTDAGAYASSANLKHWWKLGEDIDDMAKDYVVSGGIDLVNLADNINNLNDLFGESPFA